jgi:hypothetical protein
MKVLQNISNFSHLAFKHRFWRSNFPKHSFFTPQSGLLSQINTLEKSLNGEAVITTATKLKTCNAKNKTCIF